MKVNHENAKMEEDSASHAELGKLKQAAEWLKLHTPTNAKLRELAEKLPPASEWFDEDQDRPF